MGMNELYQLWDEEVEIGRNRAYLAGASAHREALNSLMETDRLQFHDRSDRGWTPPPKGYADTFEE